jgi:hypothetical protein
MTEAKAIMSTWCSETSVEFQRSRTTRVCDTAVSVLKGQEGKIRPKTGHEGPEVKQRYSSTLSVTSSLVGGEWITPRPGPFTPGTEIRYPFYMRLGGPQGQSGRVRKVSAQPGFDPRTVQPLASRYTDWAIPAPCLCFKQRKKKKRLVNHGSTMNLKQDSCSFHMQLNQCLFFCSTTADWAVLLNLNTGYRRQWQEGAITVLR